MGKVVAITNQKGGVGKTTTAVAMAAMFAKVGKKALLIDCDDSGNPSLSAHYVPEQEATGLTDIMLNRINRAGIAPRTPLMDVHDAIQKNNEGFDIIAADSHLPGITAGAFAMLNPEDRPYIMRGITDELKNEYDYVILDAAPALNILSVNLLTAADEVIITTQAQGASEEGIASLLSTIAQVRGISNPDLQIRGMLITMVDSRTKYSKSKRDEITSEFSDIGLKVFKSTIPRSVKAEVSMDKGQSIITYDKCGLVTAAYISFMAEYQRHR